MSKPKRGYTAEFKQKAVEPSCVRGNAAEVCREPGLNPSVLGRWRREAKKYGPNSFPGKGNPKLTDGQREIAELKKRSRDMEIERDNLKKGDQHLLLGRQEKYRFIKHHKFKFPVGKMCKIFKVGKSGYYHWLKRAPSKRWSENGSPTVAIRDIFNESFGSYGAPRARAELLKRGYNVSRPRVAGSMGANGSFAKRRRKFKVTTDSGHDYPLAPNILDRGFTVSAQNRVRVSDTTYIKTGEGWTYPTVIVDLFHRKVVGWSMGKTLETADTIIPAWKMAIRSNNITKELIFHSDRGSQYAGHDFANILKDHNGLVVRSMGRKGNCRDNAVAESFFKSLKVEWVYHQDYRLRSEEELSIFQWIETWYNRKRIHSTLDYRTIEEFENEMYNQKTAA
ncbi:IS3 family transposase [Maribacter sp. 2304DJ31-5]|uniref:IS3 family transposase n=1 Tax=Maribacter sp. 2304DJ31-5 TaxID=3386273 RepID=UPI0039BC2279